MLIIETLKFSLNIASYGDLDYIMSMLIGVVVWSAVWSIPNFIYFYKRRELFGIEVNHEADSNTHLKSSSSKSQIWNQK